MIDAVSAPPARPPHTCAASHVRLVVQWLDQAGHGGWAIARRAGIDEAVLNSADGWIPHAQVMALWRAGRAATGDETLGLAVAGRMGPESFALLGYSLMLGRTLGEAYRRGARDLHLVGDLFDIRVDEVEGATEIELSVTAGQEATSECQDAGLAAILVIGRRLCADPSLAPLAVEMRRPAPSDPAPFVALFGRPPRFGGARNRLLFGRADMERPVFSGHPGLADIYDRHVAAKPPATFADRLRQLLVARLPEGAATLETLAGALHVSSRTLHRRLADEGLSNRQLQDDTRKQLAAEYLARADLTLAQVGALLGFVEPASFSRAYKRWHGTPPGRRR